MIMHPPLPQPIWNPSPYIHLSLNSLANHPHTPNSIMYPSIYIHISISSAIHILTSLLYFLPYPPFYLHLSSHPPSTARHPSCSSSTHPPSPFALGPPSATRYGGLTGPEWGLEVVVGGSQGAGEPRGHGFPQGVRLELGVTSQSLYVLPCKACFSLT